MSEAKVENDYWVLSRFGPRYFTASAKFSDERRIYYSKDAISRDFGSLADQLFEMQVAS